jgi:sterol desaturase/sphingolipid hydroxylase (fatty acid hydroxylase superfamily)
VTAQVQEGLQELLALWRSLGLGPVEKNIVLALLLGLAFFVVVLVVERATRTRGTEYRSKDFLFDGVYWVWYRSGLNYLWFIALIFPSLEYPIPWLDQQLLRPYPIAVQALLFFLVSDFYVYWAHRAMHRFAPLWAIHTAHHAPERLTFASSARFHPIEIALFYIGSYLLVRLSGSDPLAWMPVLVFMEIMLQAQHTNIPWRLGPFYRILVTPTFHRFHHSRDPAHFDHNFGGVLSLWDHLFGTALPQRGPWPTALGVEGVRHDTLWSTLAHPLRLALRRRGRHAAAAAPGVVVERT